MEAIHWKETKTKAIKKKATIGSIRAFHGKNEW